MWSRLCRRQFVQPILAVGGWGAAQSCSLPWSPYRNDARHSSFSSGPTALVQCSPVAKKKLRCHGCSDHFPASQFPARQLQRTTRLCHASSIKPDPLLLCKACGLLHPRTSYAGDQVRRKSRTCMACTSSAASRSGTSRRVELGLCSECGSVYPWSCFPVDDQHKSHATCRECRSSVATTSASSVTLALGSMACTCT